MRERERERERERVGKVGLRGERESARQTERAQGERGKGSQRRRVRLTERGRERR